MFLEVNWIDVGGFVIDFGGGKESGSSLMQLAWLYDICVNQQELNWTVKYLKNSWNEFETMNKIMLDIR